MTLDIEMPKMDGITFLEKVMEHFPIRTLVISSLSTHGSEIALRALELQKGIQSIAKEIVAKIKMVAKSKLQKRLGSPQAKVEVRAKFQTQAMAKTIHSVFAIAYSTGGTEALKENI